MKLIGIMILITILIPSGLYAFGGGKTGTAYLMICAVTDTSGTVTTGLLHVATEYYFTRDQVNTNGMLLVNYRNEGGTELKPYYTKVSFGRERSIGRRVVGWYGIRGGIGQYITPMEHEWDSETKVFYINDITMSCEVPTSRHTFTTTIDTTGIEDTCTYKYTMTDNYELYDHLPLYTDIPDSFSCNVFYGGERVDINIQAIDSIKLLNLMSSRNLVNVLYDWYNTRPDAERLRRDGVGFRLILNISDYESHMRRYFKSSYWSE